MGRRFGLDGRRGASRKVHVPKTKPLTKPGRHILRLEEHYKIAPKHPGMGRR